MTPSYLYVVSGSGTIKLWEKWKRTVMANHVVKSSFIVKKAPDLTTRRLSFYHRTIITVINS